jgi:hypothetical protein
MSTKSPWYISARAVTEYLAITDRDSDGEDAAFFRAEQELAALATKIVAAGKTGKELDSGAYQFRGGKPLRLRLIVSYERRDEGDLPQLVMVKPDHEGRAGSYSRSSGPHKTKKPRSA